ncbi:DUF3077 domain-containing protein [Mitsuaria sp. RG]|nr:DUF3077 domain-containing protein [Mitsuaria sp. RG]
MMPTDTATPHTTVGKTKFYQGEGQTDPLFYIEPGIPCLHARGQASELMGCVRDLTITRIMEEKPQRLWVTYYLSAPAKGDEPLKLR